MKLLRTLQEVDAMIAALLAEQKPLLEIAESLDALDFLHYDERGVATFRMQDFRQYIKKNDKDILSLKYDESLRVDTSVSDSEAIVPIKQFLVRRKPLTKTIPEKSKPALEPKPKKEAKPKAAPRPKKESISKGLREEGIVQWNKAVFAKHSPITVSIPGALQECIVCHYRWPAKDKIKCPVCTFRIVTETNNMAVTHPELAKEYSKKNMKTASEVCANTTTMFWWQCSVCDYEWTVLGSTRVKGGGCPACSHRVVTPKNNLAVTHPKLAKEFSIRNRFRENGKLLATKVFAGTTKKLWWKCPEKLCGYEYQAAGHNRLAGTGCPECSRRKKHEEGKKRGGINRIKK